jgi:NAD-dependent aldehyde dehydrogenases
MSVTTSIHEATAADVSKAVQKAHEAFALYKATSPAQRVVFLKKIAEEINAIGDSLIAITQQETKLPEARLKGERTRTTNQIQLFAQLVQEGSWVRAIIDTGNPDRQPLPKPDIRQMQMPLGVVGVFGASNFPYAFSVAGGDTIAALAAGCPVVYKAHPGHPATSDLVAQAILKAAKDTGMPDGVFSMVQGGIEVGQSLVNHPLVKAIAFTGSFRGGKALYDTAAKREEPIPVYAEMGSVNPVFVLPGILKQKGKAVAESLATSNRLGAGQFCTNPGIVVLEQSAEADAFLDVYAASHKAAAGEPMLTETIYNQYNQSLQKLNMMADLKMIACGVKGDGAALAVPHTFVVDGKTFLQQPHLQEEVFGPASIHVLADSREQVLEIARALQGQLTASVWGADTDWEAFASLLTVLQEKAGRVIINGVPTGVEVGHAMVHGGPYPATTDSKTTSVGSQAIYRFTRPVCFQDFPAALLPAELKNENTGGILRMVNGVYTRENV